MEDISQRERMLIARGDSAIIALQAIVHQLSPALESNKVALEHLKTVLAQNPQDEKTPSLASILHNLQENNTKVLLWVIETGNTVLKEIDAFVSEAGLNVSADDGVSNIIEAIRSISGVYKDKSDQEIMELLGL